MRRRGAGGQFRMTFRKLEMPVASGLLKNSRLARFIVFFSGGVHDLKRMQPIPAPAKTAPGSIRFSWEWTRLTLQKLSIYHRALYRDQPESDQEYKGRLFLTEAIRFRVGHNRYSAIAAAVVALSLPPSRREGGWLE